MKSEKWQESYQGAEELERVESLESALESLESALESLESALESLESLEENAPEGSYM
jgi:prefoldin subunit 5